jgi:uncharacterized protein YcgI (DUF1989 family)
MDPYSGFRLTIREEEKQLYRRLASDPGVRKLVRDFTIPPRKGKAFLVDKGEILRVICSKGPQIADFNAFNRHDPRQMFWSGRTRILERTHLSVGDRLWSTPPKMEPMFTIIADTVDHRPLPHGARSHDLLYCRCNAKMWELLTGKRGQPNCQDNLSNAIAEFGLTPDYVHDAFNLFMVTGQNDDGHLFFLDSDAREGDYVELHAEMDCIVALSACPASSSENLLKQSPQGTGNLPIAVEIYQTRL